MLVGFAAPFDPTKIRVAYRFVYNRVLLQVKRICESLSADVARQRPNPSVHLSMAVVVRLPSKLHAAERTSVCPLILIVIYYDKSRFFSADDFP